MTSEANFEVFPIQNTITVAKKQSRFGFSIFFIFSFPFGIPFHIRMCVRLWHSILISWLLCFFELYLKIIMNWWLYISVYREMLLSCMNSVVTQSTQLLLCLIDIMLMVYRVCIPFSNEKNYSLLVNTIRCYFVHDYYMSLSILFRVWNYIVPIFVEFFQIIYYSIMRVYIGVQSRYIECGCPIPLLSGLFNFCCCWSSNQIYVPSQQKRASSSRLVCEAL